MYLSTLKSQNCANKIQGTKKLLVIGCTLNGALAISRTDKQADLLVDIHG